MTSNNERTFHLKVILEKDLKNEFIRVKKSLGILNNTDVIRFLIKEKAKEVERRSSITYDDELIRLKKENRELKKELERIQNKKQL